VKDTEKDTRKAEGTNEDRIEIQRKRKDAQETKRDKKKTGYAKKNNMPSLSNAMMP